MEGIFRKTPEIKKISFPALDKMEVLFNDGRELRIPIRYFPSIKKLNGEQRKKWYILGGIGFSFDDCEEVFHVEQLLGKEIDYSKY